MKRRLHERSGRSTRAAGLIACTGFALVGSAAAQDADRVTIDARRCMQIEAADERLACFEAQVGGERGEPERSAAPLERAAAPSPSRPNAANPAAAPRAPAARPAPVVRASPAPPDEGSGDRRARRQDEPEREAERAAEREIEREASEIVDTIAALRERAPYEYVISLENGQVWRQTDGERYPLRVGHRVRIYEARWRGDYRLAVEELGGFIRVARMR